MDISEKTHFVKNPHIPWRKPIFYGLVICSFLFMNGCKYGKDMAITESVDSLPRLSPGNACFPKSSFHPGTSLICYYNPTIKTVFYETGIKKGKFLIKNHGEFVTFYPHTQDSIFFMFRDSVIVYNAKGEVLKSIFYQRKFTHNGVLYRIGKTVLDVPNLCYNNKQQLLYLPCSNSETNWWEKDFFRNSMLIVGLNIKSGLIQHFPLVRYPVEYSDECYGELANYFYTLKDYNDMYISFNALPSVYKYTLSSDRPEGLKISLPDLKNVPVYDTGYKEDLNIVLEYQKRIDTYWKIIYDPFRKLFYRFHTQPTLNPQQKTHGSYPSNFDVILIIYDEEFNELKRFNFGDSVNHYGTFISYKGLHLKMFRPSDQYEYFKILHFSR